MAPTRTNRLKFVNVSFDSGTRLMNQDDRSRRQRYKRNIAVADASSQPLPGSASDPFRYFIAPAQPSPSPPPPPPPPQAAEAAAAVAVAEAAPSPPPPPPPSPPPSPPSPPALPQLPSPSPPQLSPQPQTETELQELVRILEQLSQGRVLDQGADLQWDSEHFEMWSHDIEF